jgi:CIC family chloride channel protein
LQVGAAAGAGLAGLLRLSEAQQRRLVAAGTAAGFAAAYNTPLAAVLFVLEVVTRQASVDVVVPTAWATVVATWLTRLAVGPGPLYGLRTFTWAHAAELVAYAALGLAAGVLGVAFMSFLDRGKAFAQRLRDASSWGRRWSRTTRAALGAAGGVIVGVMTLRWPQVAGNGYEAI